MISRYDRMLAGLLASCTLAAYACIAETNSQVAVTFLNKEQAQAAIVDDSMEKYFDQLQPMEMSAKTGAPIGEGSLDEQRAECRKRYKAAALAFSDEEKAVIRWHIDKLTPVLKKDYPLVGNMGWSLLKVADNIEGGLPHTRGRSIILSESMCREISAAQKRPPEQMAYLNILQLLVHEQMHVVGRMHPGFYDSLYTDLWGFEKAGSIAGCDWLVKHHLANPDAVDCPWIMPVKKNGATSHLWPLVVFSEGDGFKTMPGDFRMLAIQLEKTAGGFAVKLSTNDLPVAGNLLTEVEFRRVFPLTMIIYHPAEAAADMFAKIVIMDGFAPEVHMTRETLKKIKEHIAPLRKWFREHCKR